MSRVVQDFSLEVGIAPSDSGFQCISFVNGISTSDGGSHVDHVINNNQKVTSIKKNTKI